MLAWIPARLTAVGYAAAGHMDDAIAALRAQRRTGPDDLERSESLLARVGVAALALQDRTDETATERAIRRAGGQSPCIQTAFIWAVITAMTLYGFTQ